MANKYEKTFRLVHLYGQSAAAEGPHPMYKSIASPSSLSFLRLPSSKSPIGATATHRAIGMPSLSLFNLDAIHSASVPPAEWPRRITFC